MLSFIHCMCGVAEIYSDYRYERNKSVYQSLRCKLQLNLFPCEEDFRGIYFVEDDSLIKLSYCFDESIIEASDFFFLCSNH